MRNLAHANEQSEPRTATAKSAYLERRLLRSGLSLPRSLRRAARYRVGDAGVVPPG
jgi:hypothetical protein